jgi:HK97 family phage prohead protease/HK97 family phage major capsid protein
MDRCGDEDGMDDDSCQAMWENKSAARAVMHKTHAADVQGMEFILSDSSIDRMGDVIDAAGWDFAQFKRNPVALFNHSPSFVIGTWRNLRIDGEELRGHLQLAPAGTSDRIDEIRKLVEAGILRAVSVGFRPIEHEPLDTKAPFKGSRFIKQELIETSLVSVPANANALAVAKSLKISPETLDIVFAGKGNKNTTVVRRGFTGGQADTSRNGKGRAMTGLAQRITDLQTQMVDKEDELNAHLEGLDDSNVSDADLETTNRLNAEITQLNKTHTALVDSEKLLAKNLDGGGNGHVRSRAISTTVLPPGDNRITVPAMPRAPQNDPINFLVRAAVVAYAAKTWNAAPDATRAKIAERHPEYNDENTRIACDLVLRAASAPAMTTVAGWAQELARTDYTDLMPLLMPRAVLTRLAAKGLTLSFGQAGRIVIPTRSRTPTIAGSFVGEGLAIPVRQGAFTSQTLTPKKLAVISTWTREMADHSVPAIEGLIREAITQDTTVAVDSILLDNNAATTVRPAGLLNGVSTTTATAGGGIAALIGDIKALTTALVTSTFGNLRSPVWLMNPGDMLAASLLQATNTGIFPFRDEIRAGTLNTIPIIDSATVTAKTVILVDAADFVVVGGGAPRMEMSDQATLHMEDTSPAELVASPSTVAAPQRSLFQTDSIALRMVTPLNWVQRRTGTIAWTSSVTWS